MNEPKQFQRLRQRRSDAQTRERYAETGELGPEHFILPLFVREEAGKAEIPSLEGVYSYGIDALLEEMPYFLQLGLRKFLLFGAADAALKDDLGQVGQGDDALIARVLRALRQKFAATSDLCLMTDICLCAYTDHGHCGVLSQIDGSWQVDNDATLPHYVSMATAHARAGADWVAPSGMMDGQVAALRQGLDAAGFAACKILAYSAKYASALYGPFRLASGSSPKNPKEDLPETELEAKEGEQTLELRHRKTYQMDYRNAEEALREIEADLNEGADQLMIKPAITYLDVVSRAAQFLQQRGRSKDLVAYHVSGEYMMWRSAVNAGVFEAFSSLREIFFALRRAGAEQIISYAAPYYLESHREQKDKTQFASSDAGKEKIYAPQ